MTELATTPVVILCGGRGTRLNERTAEIPKPLVEIGGRPILWHVLQLYLHHGFRRFVLCLGYKGEAIEQFVNEAQWGSDVEIACMNTGLETPTGGRVSAVKESLGETTFGVTYADGLADIDLAALLRFHQSHGSSATVTAVRPSLPFGVMELGDTKVEAFVEKPQSEHWINGGFFWFEPQTLERLGPGSVLEREPLESLSDDGELVAYRHEGFWECMDTYKDAVLLNDLWSGGAAPWKVWNG